MKLPDAAATHSATATPATPTDLNASSTLPRSTTTTYANSAAAANAARPQTWVGVSSVSWRWRTPAVDHATAASATYIWPRRWRRDSSSATVAVVTPSTDSASGVGRSAAAHAAHLPVVARDVPEVAVRSDREGVRMAA